MKRLLLAVVRYLKAGSIDSSFGSSGKVVFTTAQTSSINALLLQSDGKILGAGNSWDGLSQNFILLRFAVDGSLDSSFGTNGIVINSTIEMGSLALQPDSSIVVAGSVWNGNNSDFAVFRYDSNGAIDSSFGYEGMATTDFDNSYDNANCVSIGIDGEIVIGGTSDGDFALARYISGLNVGIIDLSSLTNSGLIYPNPIEQTATFKYALKIPQTVSIRLLNVQGKVLKTFMQNEKQDVGEHQQEISFPDLLPSGFYFLTISSANGGNVSVKIVK